MKPTWLGLAAAALLSFASSHAFATTRICVSVQQKSWYRPPAPPPAAPAPPAAPSPAPALGPQPAPASAPGAPIEPPQPGEQAPRSGGAPPTGNAKPARPEAPRHEIDPTLYLKRMLEYEVTHEVGFAAVDERCEQRLSVELYPLETGWTVFARYSGTEREEKIDHAEMDEFGELAQRIAFALLRNRPINQTITRENVLRSDSEMNLRTIDGTGHILFGMGTEVRVAHLPTAGAADAPATEQLRVLTPLSVQLGYRRKLRAWGLDIFARANLGTENTGIHHNDLGGHVDYTGSGMLGLHFLHYTDAPGVTSFYFGGGAAFELAFFESIRPAEVRGAVPREGLMGGGLNLDLLVGYEFLRASSVHFFGQIEIDAPAYLLKTENNSGAIDTYAPSALAQIGVIF